MRFIGNFFAGIGRTVVGFLAYTGRLASFTGRSLAAIVSPPHLWTADRQPDAAHRLFLAARGGG